MSQSVSERQLSEPQISNNPTNSAAPALADAPIADLVEPAANLRFDLSQIVTSEAMASNADELMNSLFADVEHMLERGVLPPEPPIPAVEPAAPQPQPVISLEAILTSKLGPRDLIPQAIEPEQPEQPEQQHQPEPTKSTKKSWNPLWVAVLCSSMLLSIGILSFLFRAQLLQVWSGVLGKFYAGAPVTVADPSANQASQPKAKDEDFLHYLQQSLDRLAHRGAEMLPSPSPTVAASPSPTVVERVYVPVYPTASPSAPPSASSQTPSSATTAPTGTPTRTQTNQPAPLPTAPAASPVPNIAAANNHTLLGVLELGEKSAALFEVNGIPQRIEMGEPIGTSGWMLVSIKDQEAIVRRNGEVRSIYVGQKF